MSLPRATSKLLTKLSALIIRHCLFLEAEEHSVRYFEEIVAVFQPAVRFLVNLKPVKTKNGLMVSTPIKELKLEQNVWRRPFRIYWTAHAQITVPSVASRYWGRSFRYSRTPGLTEKSWYSVSRDSEDVV